MRALTSVLVVGVLLLTTSVTVSQAATPHATHWSSHTPPPVCTSSSTGPCVQQPGVDEAGITATPVKVDMPVVSRVPSAGPAQPSLSVTFSITAFARPNPGMVMDEVGWANPIELDPIPGYSDKNAQFFAMTPADNCATHPTCTYTTNAVGQLGGWYYAGYSGHGLVLQHTCEPNSPNGVAGCSYTVSQSALYIPDSADLQPPRVAVATAGRGLTTKAIAAARDPYHKPMTLVWDFGDGSSPVAGRLGQAVTHQYAAPGGYSVTARVRTSDGRTGANSADARVAPPKPIVQAVAPTGSGNSGVAAALLQGWPPGGRAVLHYWTSGCPADVAGEFDSAPGFSNYAPVHDDGTVSLPIGYLDPTANAFAVQATTYVRSGTRVTQVQRVSDCVTSLGTLSTTTADSAAGATNVPVGAPGVAAGHVAVIDAGTANSEQRTVTTVNSGVLTLDSALAGAHPSGSEVLDAGPPAAPYVVPPPPGSPTAPAAPPVEAFTAPGRPTITNLSVTRSHAAVLTFRPGTTGGTAITDYSARCVSSDHGHTATASGRHGPLTVPNLSAGKRYTCAVRAANAVGNGAYSSPTRAFTA